MSDLLNRLARNAAREAKRQVRLASQASEHTTLDEWVLRDLKDASPAFREQLERPITYEAADGVVETYAPSMDVHDDLFLGNHTPGETRTRAAEEMKPSHKLGRDVLDAYFKTPEHKDMKPYTEQDKIASAIATRAAVEVFDEMFRADAMRDAVEESQTLDNMEQALEDWQLQIDDLRAQAQDAIANGDPVPGDTGERMKRLIEQREQTAQALAQVAANSGLAGNPTAQQAIKDAAQAAGAKAAEMTDTWSALAGLGAAEFVRENPDDAFVLCEQWQQLADFQEFMRLIGRLARDFRAQEARNVIGGDDDIIGVTAGADLTKILPTELARLGNPLTQRSFYRDFVDESLLMYDTQGSERASMGPGILCVDLSGSMDGTKAHEAKAVAVGFVRLMHRKRRDAVVICFNGRVMWEHHFARGTTMPMPVLFDLASLSPNGGTDITTAIARAEHHLKSSHAFKRADVIVVTDGQDRFEQVDADFRDSFLAMGVRSHGIAIGHEPASGGWLLSFCDDAISVASLTQATGDIVRAIS